MRKIYLLAVSVMMFTACVQETEIGSQVSGDTSAAVDTRADVIELTQVKDYWNYHSICLDAEGYLYGMYCKSGWTKFDDSQLYGYSYEFGFNEFFNYCKLSRSACVDINDACYFITQENRLVKIDMYNVETGGRGTIRIEDQYQRVDFIFSDLSMSFPSGTVFLSLTAADNGNVFVATGKSSDGEYGDTFPKQTVYRIASNGNVTEIAIVNAPVSATLVTDWSELPVIEWSPSIPQIEYPSIISKAKGTVLYGLDADGNGYKVSTTTGAVEYFTPRVPVKCMAAALNGNNPYAISGNSIIEIRPSLAKDIVVGTIPADIASDAHTLLVDADATTFYIGVTNEYGGSYVYKFTR